MKYVILMAGILAATASAQAAQCLDEKVVSSVKEIISLEGENWDKEDLCDPSTNTYKTLEMLSLIKQISFADRQIKMGPFDQQILPKDFWGYFQEHVSYIVNEDECRKGVVAFVYGAWKDRVVHLCPYFYEDSFNIYERAETVLHEARHFEGFGHVTCVRKGPRTGQAGACDNNIQEKGSYAVTVESLAKMGFLAEGLADPVRAQLKNSSLVYDEAFNEPILPEGFLSSYMITQAKDKGLLFDGTRLLEVPAITNAKIISRTSALAAFPLDKTDAYTVNAYSAALDHLPAQGSFSLGYNKKPIMERPEVVDILNGDTISGSLNVTEFDGRLVKDQSAEYTNIKLPFRAKQLLQSSEIGADVEDSVFLLSEENELYQLQLLGNKESKLEKVPNILGDLQKILKISDKTFALNKDGELVGKLGEAWLPVQALQGIRLDQASRPFYWTEYFADEGLVKKPQ